MFMATKRARATRASSTRPGRGPDPGIWHHVVPAPGPISFSGLEPQSV